MLQYEIGYRVPFKREYFRIKEFDSLSIYYADWWWLLSLNGVNEYSNNVQILVRDVYSILSGIVIFSLMEGVELL